MNKLSGGQKVECRILGYDESCIAHLIEFTLREMPGEFAADDRDFWVANIELPGKSAGSFLRELHFRRKEVMLTFSEGNSSVVGNAMMHMNLGMGTARSPDGHDITIATFIGLSRLTSAPN